MDSNTKLFRFIKNIKKKTEEKIVFLKSYFTNGIFFLFFGFLSGNMFGSFLHILRESIVWDGFVTIVIIFFCELISFMMYRSEKRTAFLKLGFLNLNTRKKSIFFKLFQTTYFYIFGFCKKIILRTYIFFYTNFNIYLKAVFIKSINLFKIGILLGFFIDAFKVGS